MHLVQTYFEKRDKIIGFQLSFFCTTGSVKTLVSVRHLLHLLPIEVFNFYSKFHFFNCSNFIQQLRIIINCTRINPVFRKVHLITDLSELPMWLMDGFLVFFFLEGGGEQCAYTLIPLWLTCGSHAGWWGGGDSELQKTQIVQKISNFHKGGREHWQPF